MWVSEATRQLHPAEVCGNTWWPHTTLDRHKPAHTQFQVSYKRLSILSMYIFPPRSSLCSRAAAWQSFQRLHRMKSKQIRAELANFTTCRQRMSIYGCQVEILSKLWQRRWAAAAGWVVWGPRSQDMVAANVFVYWPKFWVISYPVAKIVFYLCRIFTVSLADSWHKCWNV